MLRKKLKLGNLESNTNNFSEGENASDNSNNSVQSSSLNVITEDSSNSITSPHFATPFWKQFYDLELSLNDEIQNIQFESRITHVYNPIIYASDLHCAYLRKFLTGQKKVMFVGMNPGPNGMGQTGIPFGNIKTVRNYMKLEGSIEQPNIVHPKRPVDGLSCRIEEPSGVRFWNLLLEISSNLDVFGKQCFMHNFCPLAFFDGHGHNITPSELKGNSKTEIRDVCLKYLDKEIQLVNPEIVIAVGSYVGDCLKRLQKLQHYQDSKIKFLILSHPSPRSLNNTNWPEKARQFFVDNDLIKYIKNESIL